MAAPSEHDEPTGLLSALKESWHAIFGRIHVGDNEMLEAARAGLQRLVELGKLQQEEARKLLADFGERIEGNRREIERRVDDGVKAMLTRVGLPARDDLDSLNRTLAELEERVARLGKDR